MSCGRKLSKKELELARIAQEQKRIEDSQRKERDRVEQEQKEQELLLKQLDNIRIEKQRLAEEKVTIKTALKISKVFRGHKVRKEYKIIKEQLAVKKKLEADILKKKTDAALEIQGAWRRHRVRKSTAKAREQNRMKSQYEKPAIVIQRVFRGYSTRNRLRREKDGSFKAEAAILIQKVWRGHLTRVRLEMEKKSSERRELEQDSATKIQSVYRGFICRKNYQEEKTSNRRRVKEDDEEEERQRERKRRREFLECTIIFQRNIRGFLARERFGWLKRLSVQVQAAARGYLGRKRASILHRQNRDDELRRQSRQLLELRNKIKTESLEIFERDSGSKPTRSKSNNEKAFSQSSPITISGMKSIQESRSKMSSTVSTARSKASSDKNKSSKLPLISPRAAERLSKFAKAYGSELSATEAEDRKHKTLVLSDSSETIAVGLLREKKVLEERSPRILRTQKGWM